MKLLPAFLTMALAGCATAQEQSAPLQIVQIHDAAGKSKAEVCRAARDWAAQNFRDSKAVVEVYDLEAGTMIGKGRVTVAGFAGTLFPIEFTLQVDCKDGRARSSYGTFMTSVNGSSFPLRDESINNLRVKTEARILELDHSLDIALKTASGKDAW